MAKRTKGAEPAGSGEPAPPPDTFPDPTPHAAWVFKQLVRGADPGPQLDLLHERFRHLSRRLLEVAPEVRLAKIFSWPSTWYRAVTSADPEAPPPPVDCESIEFDQSDLGNARRFAAAARARLRHVPQWGSWLVWGGRSWVPDETLRHLAIAKEAAEALKEDGNVSEKWVAHTHSRRGFEAMVSLARPELAASPEDFDRNPWLFNVANGTLDLRTGELRPHDAADLITKVVPIEYDPEAECPNFLRFLGEIHPGEDGAEIASYLQRRVGYCMTGILREQAFFVDWGPRGRNGKNMLLKAVQAVLGPYAVALNHEVILVQSGSPPHPTSLVALKGARLAYCDELEDGKRLNESQIKRVTGGAPITARQMHKNEFNFTPTAKLLLLTNYRPQIMGQDGGIWSRVQLAQFRVHYTDKAEEVSPPWTMPIDPDYWDRHLAQELPGILAWAVRGSREWLVKGLLPPDSVRRDTRNYRLYCDRIAMFIEEKCEVRAESEVKGSDLYRAYSAWCRDGNLTPLSVVKFVDEMERRGFPKSRHADANYRSGLHLKGGF